MVSDFIIFSREFLFLILQMSESIMTFFTTPLKDLQDKMEFPGMLNNVLDAIFNVMPIGAYSPMQLMFGSGIIIIILIAVKNFIV